MIQSSINLLNQADMNQIMKRLLIPSSATRAKRLARGIETACVTMTTVKKSGSPTAPQERPQRVGGGEVDYHISPVEVPVRLVVADPLRGLQAVHSRHRHVHEHVDQVEAHPLLLVWGPEGAAAQLFEEEDALLSRRCGVHLSEPAAGAEIRQNPPRDRVIVTDQEDAPLQEMPHCGGHFLLRR